MVKVTHKFNTQKSETNIINGHVGVVRNITRTLNKSPQSGRDKQRERERDRDRDR